MATFYQIARTATDKRRLSYSLAPDMKLRNPQVVRECEDKGLPEPMGTPQRTHFQPKLHEKPDYPDIRYVAHPEYLAHDPQRL